MPADRIERPLTIAVGLFAVVVQLPIWARWFGLLDEGYILALADDINQGKVLYRDVYVDAPFPGAFYLLAGWFRLAGTSIYASRLLAVGAFALLVVLLFRIAREVLSRRAALAVVLAMACYRIWAFPHWQVYSYSAVAVTLATAAVAVMLVHLRSVSRRSATAAGLLAGGAILCKQDYGLGVAGAIGLALLGRTFLRARVPGGGRTTAASPIWFVAGAALAVLPALGYFAWEGALGALASQAILLPLSGAQSFDYTRLPPLWPLVGQDRELRRQIGSYFPSILLTLRWDAIATSRLYRDTGLWDGAIKAIFYAPVLLWCAAALAWGGQAIARGRRLTFGPADERHLLLLAYGGGLLLAFNRPRDWVHLMMVYPPAIVIGATLLSSTCRRAPWLVGRIAAAAVGLGLALLGTASVRLALELRRSLTWPLETSRAGVRVDVRNGPLVDDALAYIDQHAAPGAPVPVYPTQPMVGFLAGRETVAGFHVIWPVQPPDRDARIIADLEQRAVGTIIYSVSQYAHLGTFRENAPALFDYLVDRYRITQVFSRELYGPLLCALGRRPEVLAPSRSLLELTDRTLARERWPFAEVLAQRIGTPAAPAPARLGLDVPNGAPRLVLAYGINPDRWLGLTSGPFTFTLAVDGSTLLDAVLDPARRLEDRRWVAADVDLGAWAGRRVTLDLAIGAPDAPEQPASLAGWAEPRIMGHP